MLMNLMSFFNTHVKARVQNEKGQGMVEYGLIIAVVAIVLIVTFGNLNTDITGLIDGIRTQLTTNTP